MGGSFSFILDAVRPKSHSIHTNEDDNQKNPILPQPQQPMKKPSFLPQTKPKLTYKDFTYISTLGSGACGQVFLVKRQNREKVYAMKVIKKSKVL